MPNVVSTDTALGIFFRGNTDCFGEGLEEIAVVGETALFESFRYTEPVAQECFGNADPPGGNVFIDGSPGGRFENAADVGFAQIEFRRKLSDGEWGRYVLVNIFQDVVYLMIIDAGSGRFGRVVVQGEAVEQHEKFHEGGLLQNIMAVPFRVRNLVDVVQETALLLLTWRNLMAEIPRAAGEAGVQVGLSRGETLGVFGMDRQNDAFMHCLVHLCDLVALILVNDKKVARLYRIEFIIYQKLLAAGDGIVDFVTIMDVHVHGFFFFIKMGQGESLGGGTAFYGLLAGREFFHMEGSFPGLLCS